MGEWTSNYTGDVLTVLDTWMGVCSFPCIPPGWALFAYFGFQDLYSHIAVWLLNIKTPLTCSGHDQLQQRLSFHGVTNCWHQWVGNGGGIWWPLQIPQQLVSTACCKKKNYGLWRFCWTHGALCSGGLIVASPLNIQFLFLPFPDEQFLEKTTAFSWGILKFSRCQKQLSILWPCSSRAEEALSVLELKYAFSLCRKQSLLGILQGSFPLPWHMQTHVEVVICLHIFPVRLQTVLDCLILQGSAGCCGEELCGFGGIAALFLSCVQNLHMDFCASFSRTLCYSGNTDATYLQNSLWLSFLSVDFLLLASGVMEVPWVPRYVKTTLFWRKWLVM